MKLRIAKKIMCSMSKSRRKRLNELYPPFYSNGHYVMPSWHKYPVINKARNRIIHYCRKGNKI